MRSGPLKLLLLPGLAGILLFCCFPIASQGYVAWTAFVPLVWFVARAPSGKQAFLGGFVAGALAWFGLLVWIPRVVVHYGGVPESLAWILYLLLVSYLSCYPAVACLLTSFCIRRGGEKCLLIFPFAWVALEYARGSFMFGGFPWLLAGYSQTGYLHLMQLADVTGVYGLSFLLLWINTSFAWLALRRFKPGGVWPVAVGLALVGASVAYGQIMLNRWEKTSPSFSAALLQENLSFDEDEAVLKRKFGDGYVQMASRLPPGSADLLVLPESPSPLAYEIDTSYREALQKLARSFPLGMIFNNISYSQEGGESKYFNSAYFLGQDGQELGRYDKIHLVPFGEYVPLKKLFFFVDAVSKDVSDFSPGQRYLTAQLQGHRVNAIICFEAVFPDLVRRFVRAGSELIVNLTNDGWYGDSAAPYQHLAMSRWRAVENRRYLLRATNSGISAIVDPTGMILASTPLLQQDICAGRFAFLQGQTIYMRCGDAFAILCAIIMICMFVYSCLFAKKKG